MIIENWFISCRTLTRAPGSENPVHIPYDSAVHLLMILKSRFRPRRTLQLLPILRILFISPRTLHLLMILESRFMSRRTLHLLLVVETLVLLLLLLYVLPAQQLADPLLRYALSSTRDKYNKIDTEQQTKMAGPIIRSGVPPIAYLLVKA